MTPVSTTSAGMQLAGSAPPSDHAVKGIAAMFVAARREARALAVYPGERPLDLATAYRIQDWALALDGRAVAGWKVGRIHPPADTLLGADRLAGPIFADEVASAAPGEVPTMPVLAKGFAAAEAEFLIHLAPGWSGAVPADDAATAALADDVRLGIEIASSPYPGINADGPCVTVSDYGNNRGLVIGPRIEGWGALDLSAIAVETMLDGHTVGQQTAATMLDGPWGAVRFLLGNLAARGIDASRGVWISTGAVTGVHEVAPGAQVVARFGSHGSVACTISAAERPA